MSRQGKTSTTSQGPVKATQARSSRVKRQVCGLKLLNPETLSRLQLSPAELWRKESETET
jgi:hypothetical protein